MKISTREWKKLTKEQKFYLLCGTVLLQKQKDIYTPYIDMFE